MEKTEVIRVLPETSTFHVLQDPTDFSVVRLQGQLEGPKGPLQFEASNPNNRFVAANLTSSHIEVYKEK